MIPTTVNARTRASSEAVLGREVHHAQRQRPLVGAVEDDQRQEEVRSTSSTMASTLTVASAGRASGSSTRQKNPNELQPSIRAASSSSVGMLRKNGRRITIVSGRAKRPGAARRRAGCRQPELADEDVQRQDRDGGREQQAEHEQRVERPRGPGTAIRANANAASEANGTVSVTATAAIDDAVEQPAARRSGRTCRSARRCSSSNTHGFGRIRPGSATSWPLVLNPPEDRVERSGTGSPPRRRAGPRRRHAGRVRLGRRHADGARRLRRDRRSRRPGGGRRHRVSRRRS